MLGPRREQQCFHDGMRADVVLTNMKRACAVDVAITGIDSGRSFAFGAAKPGGACDDYAAKAKLVKYGPIALALGFDFVPLVFDTHGAVGEQGTAFLRMLARAWGGQFDILPSRAVPLITQRVSAVLMRGYAQLLLANAAAG